MNKNTTSSYDFPSRAFHWVTAIVVIIAFVLGPGDFGQITREGIDPATRSDIVWHESLGMLVFVMTALRLIWVTFRPAVPQVNMPSWMRVTGKLVHIALWTLLFALPTTALLSLGSEGHPLTLLGGIRISQLSVIADVSISTLTDWGAVQRCVRRIRRHDGYCHEDLGPPHAEPADHPNAVG